MRDLQTQDIHKLKQLLQHASEFIAYFELAETKMLEWRQELEQHTTAIKQMAQDIDAKLSSCKELLSQTGIDSLRDITEKALTKGDATLRTLEKSYVDLNHHLQEQQDQLKEMTQTSIQNIELHVNQSLELIVSQLSKYDVKLFHRIANESCDHVERVAQNAVHKSNKLFRLFQWRFGVLMAVTTVISAFCVLLYVTDEAPWETHQHARNEREAGRLLLNAWPDLSQQEKSKILHQRGTPRG